MASGYSITPPIPPTAPDASPTPTPPSTAGPAAAAAPAAKAPSPATRTAGRNPFSAILEVSSALVSSLDLDEVFHTVAERIGEAMMVWGVELQSHDAAGALTHESCWSMDGTTEADRERLGAPVDLQDRFSLAGVLTRKTVVERRVDDPGLPADERRALEGRKFKSVLYAPLVMGAETIGLLTAVEPRFARHFTPMECDLFRQLCDIAAGAISNAKLYRRLEEQKRRTMVLETTQALTSSTGMDEVLNAILDVVADTFAFEAVDIYELSGDDAMVCVAAHGDMNENSASWVGTALSFDEHSDYRRVFEDRIIAEYHADEELQRTNPELYDQMLDAEEVSVVETGLFFGDTAVGCLSLCSRNEVRRLNDDEKDFLLAVASAAAAGIRNAQTHRYRTMVLDATRAIASATDLDTTLATITRAATTAIHASAAAVYTYDAELDAISYEALYTTLPSDQDDSLGTPYPLDTMPTERTTLLGRRVVYERLDDPALPADRRESMEAWTEYAVLSVPLWFGDTPLGILRLYEMEHPRRFTDSETELAAGLGEQASIAIHSAKGHETAAKRSHYIDCGLRAARALASSADAGEACGAVVRICREAFGAERAAVYAVDAAAGTLTIAGLSEATAAGDPDVAGGAGTADGAEALDAEPGRRALLGGTEALVEQLSDPALDAAARAAMERRGDRTRLSIPLHRQGRPVGILTLHWTRSEARLHGDELAFAQSLAEQAALALRTA